MSRDLVQMARLAELDELTTRLRDGTEALARQLRRVEEADRRAMQRQHLAYEQAVAGGVTSPVSGGRAHSRAVGGAGWSHHADASPARE